MLVMTLSEDEYLEIGNGIRVYFQRHKEEDALSVAIDAPADNKILRGKLYEAANPARRNTGIKHRRNTRGGRHAASNTG